MWIIKTGIQLVEVVGEKEMRPPPPPRADREEEIATTQTASEKPSIKKISKDLPEVSSQFLKLVEQPNFPTRLIALIPKERQDWVRRIKTVRGRRWHSDPHQFWTIPYTKDVLTKMRHLFGEELKLTFEPKADIPDTYVPPKKPKKSKVTKKNRVKEPLQYEEALIALEEKLMLKRYSFATIKSYKSHFRAFLWFYNDSKPEEISEKQIVNYVLRQIEERNISESTQNGIINAIKFYYEEVLGKPRTVYNIPRPKKPKKLPGVLSEEEVTRLIKSVENLKHKCILLLIYSAGLRLGEVTNLKVTDIHSDSNYIFIKDAKGKKRQAQSII